MSAPSPSAIAPSGPHAASVKEVSAASMLEAIGRSSLADDGHALIVSIEAIKTALGPRWGPRRSQIYEVVERNFRKYLSPTDIWQPAGEAYFLVVAPETSPLVAQALCYRALKEVLTFFLGEVNPLHLQVNRVTGISNDRIEMEPYTVAQLEQADREAVIAAQEEAKPPSSLSTLASWPLTTADGQNLRVSFAVEPVLDLKSWAMAGHRIESRILNLQTGLDLNGTKRRMLLPRDFEKIDLAALERGMSRLRGGTPDRASLIIQLSFASLSNSRARSALLARAGAMSAALKQGAICELVDVEAGVPVGRLIEVASLVRSAFRGVFVQVEPKRNAVESALGASLYGLSVRAADLGSDAASISAAARDFVVLLKGRKTLLTVTSLPSPDLLVAVLAAGFTHATLRASPPPS